MSIGFEPPTAVNYLRRRYRMDYVARDHRTRSDVRSFQGRASTESVRKGVLCGARPRMLRSTKARLALYTCAVRAAPASGIFFYYTKAIARRGAAFWRWRGPPVASAQLHDGQLRPQEDGSEKAPGLLELSETAGRSM